MLGRSQATDEELATTLVNIEAALNSRPITLDTEDALTPAHFLYYPPEQNHKWREISRRHTTGHKNWQTTLGSAAKRQGSSRRHRPPPRGSPPQAHVEEGPGGGAEGGKRRGQKNSRTPWSRRKSFSPPYSAGHPPGG